LAFQFVPRYFEPYRRGFSCNDPAIRLPYKHSTVSTSLLLAVIFIGPLFAILITEFCRSSRYKELYSWRGYSVNQVLVNCFKYYAYHLLAVLLTFMIVTPTKYIVGELRPNFVDVCRPVYDMLSCRNQSYIEIYRCRGRDNAAVKDARLSFFSGHSALAMATAVFFVSRVTRRGLAIIIRPLAQMAAICLALYTGYSRIMDGKHHLHDIIVGYVVGAIIAYLTARHIAELKTGSHQLKDNEARLRKIDVSSPDDNAPAYKTSVVRIEPTELRLFD
ncbi:unnamed protein product, partial [Gongylonema pulchrum]|uniref:AcidPPc domain-containing protein n=1 Tax=Gongylonema pulchrum TaxID=637853 RepID=A0A183CXR1_9BILA